MRTAARDFGASPPRKHQKIARIQTFFKYEGVYGYLLNIFENPEPKTVGNGYMTVFYSQIGVYGYIVTVVPITRRR